LTGREQKANRPVWTTEIASPGVSGCGVYLPDDLGMMLLGFAGLGFAGYRRAQVRVVPVQAYPAFFLALGFAGCFSAASFAAPLPIIGNSITR
jgi:hypothetical protein